MLQFDQAGCAGEGRRSGTLLLVDDEENILSSLKRLLRVDGFRILTAGSGAEALALMAREAVDVVVSDQRMPQMTGVEFLRQARDLYPDTVRIVLSGYTDLKSVTDAINEGSIYKFLTKPWDDAMLRANIDEAFRRKALGDENRRLASELREANARLEQIASRQEDQLERQRHRIALDERSLGLAQEALARLPVAVLGIDCEGMVAFANEAALALFDDPGALVGTAADCLPSGLRESGASGEFDCAGKRFRILQTTLGPDHGPRGRLLTLIEEHLR